MLVKDRMTLDPMVIRSDASHSEALRVLQAENFRYLPVVDEKGDLTGIVTEADLLHAAPSSATSLSMYEMNYLLANLKVEEVMSSPPITVPEDTPLEEAARVMIENDVGFLPVTCDGKLVGVITETDIFRTFVEILGSGESVLRVTLRAPDVQGELARLSGMIADLGGDIRSVASFWEEDPGRVYFTFRVQGVGEDILIPALEEMGEEVVHVCHAA